MKNNIGNDFLRLTQYKFLEESDRAKGVPQPPSKSRKTRILCLSLTIPKPSRFRSGI